MKTKSKLPKGMVMFAYKLHGKHLASTYRDYDGSTEQVGAFIPCRTRKEAAAVVRLHGEKYEQLVERAAKALYMDDTGQVKGRAARWELCLKENGIELWFLERKAKRVLTALGLAKEGKEL